MNKRGKGCFKYLREKFPKLGDARSFKLDKNHLFSRFSHFDCVIA